MEATQPMVRERRASRWLARHGSDLGPVGEDARALLGARLEAARRTYGVWVVLGAVGLLVLAPALGGMFDGTAAGREDFAGRYVVAIGLVEVAGLVSQALARRADRLIAEGLPHRVARVEHVGVVTVLGRRAAVATVATAGLAAVWCAVLLGTGQVRLGVPVTIWFVLAAVLAALGLRGAVTRPAVACDAVSLAIDERLRSHEAMRAIQMLWVVWLAAALAVAGPSSSVDRPLSKAFLMTFLVVTLLQMVAQAPRGWATSSRDGTS